ncbi:MAG: tRNA uridine-5-carboxymethylaminomethyl(34) synthesis enzyme MnmG [Phycisphaeraceae bacterium]
MPDPTLQSDGYAVLVIGGGHAGAEAAWAAANLLRPDGRRVALVTMDPARIGQMSCNPAIGGLAKGQIVREVDALGGLMGLAADATGIQFRILNASKGPAVRGPRCQSDKYRYAREVQRLLATRENLDILAGTVDDILTDAGRCTGVVYVPASGEQPIRLDAGAVVLTTGTFMRGLLHTGQDQAAGGRTGEAAANRISDTLRRLGFELGRLKTGTPPRLDAKTIDLAALELQPGDAEPVPFSDMTGQGESEEPAYARTAERFPVIEQRPCWVTRTTAAAHEAIRANLDRAPLFNGQVESTGPRYCPSIEDKVVRFPDRESHHVFLEPESLETDEIYCNGISTSLPRDVQEKIVRELPGCENARILRYGYAVEYDMVWPHQIDATCMSKPVPGLLLAGQINCTTGYEEAAGQGVLAGLNAVRHVRGEEPVRLRRDQAYVGVLMDDLVTKVPREPYRMFTSRAEYRLLLRADNADERLTPLGRELGLVDDARWRVWQQREAAMAALRDYVDRHKLDGASMSKWLLRPEVTPEVVLAELNGDPLPALARDRRLVARVLADYQYAGYIQRQQREVEKLAAQESRPLPTDLDYGQIDGLRSEAAHVLSRFRPATLGQAGRLAGVNPADLMVVSLALGR